MATCVGEKDKNETAFIKFTRTLVKSFTLLVVVVIAISIKNNMINENTTLFSTALFIIVMTILFTIVGVVDSYVYSNLVLGVGLAIGLQIMDWRKVTEAAASAIETGV